MNLRLHRRFLILALLVGCSSGVPAAKFTRNPLDGTVTLDGKPLAKGTISFEPEPGSKAATAGGAVITDGRFDFPKESGLVAGTYRVFITSPESNGPAPKSADDLMNNPPPPAKEMVPEKYNVQSMLTAEIAKDQKTSLKYELKTSE